MAFVSDARIIEVAQAFPDFLISNGGVAGLSFISKFGYLAALGVTKAPITTLGTGQAYLAAAAQLKVSSGDANDTSVDGTGAKTVFIQGLDANFQEASETVSITGQTAVTTTNSYIFPHRAYVTSAGSGETNAGIIYFGAGTVTAGVPATKYLAIPAGEGQTKSTQYMIPAGKTGFLKRVAVSTFDNNNDYVTARLEAKYFDEGVWRTQTIRNVYRDNLDVFYPVGRPYTEKTILRVTGAASANSLDASAEFDIILVDNA